MARLGCSFFQCQSFDYLIVVDYYSRYTEVAAMTKNKTRSKVVRALKSIFATHGIPEKVHSDNSPPFDSGEYATFANDWGFKITTSSPKFRRSNEEAERAAQTAKSILKKEKDEANALAYRSTPLSCGYSPAPLLIGRNIRSTLSTFHSQLNPKNLNVSRLCLREQDNRLQQQVNFNRIRRGAPLSTLQPGKEVVIRSHDQPGTVVKEVHSPRSYVIETPTKNIRRKRDHLVPLDSKPPAAKKLPVKACYTKEVA